jgi:catechol 2,3-dioxygenase-like lactoylglutathione lyase family enzyme
MLKDFDLVANIAVKDKAVSKKFYGETLGLVQIDESDFGVTYKSGASRLFVYPAPTAGTNQATAASWEVPDIKAVTGSLEGKVEFEHYEYPGAEHDGPIHTMGGMSAAWFKDPDGNILGIVQTNKP